MVKVGSSEEYFVHYCCC